jgi:hypothetical protein
MRYINLSAVILNSIILALFWSGSLSTDIWNYGYIQLFMGQLASAGLLLAVIQLLKETK